MYEGVLILESLKVGSGLAGVSLGVRGIRRVEVEGTSAEQPGVWSLVEFSVEDGERLAGMLAEVLDAPGWYADFRDERETFVVFPGRVFRYARGDDAAREAAKEFGRGLRIPEAQLDWGR
ncbi:hypothetical protein GCM10009630_69420 [Kribbella jejuensis]|uniref:Uncharacterized protein n=1 Tax=Kribbella jejuensis TaxID=236068 RepID=A0A542EQK2_9ACTN|nr:hypothetical protein [Kribbella jejuensis]TQJ17627.1 hypothetical protein FB475_1753 [Kribbella jejuensis]